MFETHMLSEKGKAEVKVFKIAMTATAERVLETMPEGREKSIFKTKLEEAVFYGTKAVASKPENHTEILSYSMKNEENKHVTS